MHQQSYHNTTHLYRTVGLPWLQDGSYLGKCSGTMHSVGVALSERVLEHQMVEEGPCSHQVGQMSNTQPHTGNLDMLSGCIVGVGLLHGCRSVAKHDNVRNM